MPKHYTLLYPTKFTLSFRWFLTKLLIVGAMLLMGCGTARVKIYKELNSGSYVRKDSHPYKVAILPFAANEKYVTDKPNIILREVFYTYFSYLGYADMPPTEVDKRLRVAGYKEPEKILQLSLRELKELLNVDAVIKGRVLNANNFTGGFYAETWINARLLMVDIHTGNILWETEHSQRDQSSIASLTLTHIIQQQLKNIETQKAYYKVAEEFSVNVLKEVPDPIGLPGTKIHPPVIFRLKTNLQPNHKLRAHEVLKITLIGAPGLTASYDIGNWKTTIPLKETNLGVYTGSYKVLSEDQISDALIVGRLKDQQGLTSKKIFKGTTFTIENSQNLNQANNEESSTAKF